MTDAELERLAHQLEAKGLYLASSTATRTLLVHHPHQPRAAALSCWTEADRRGRDALAAVFGDRPPRWLRGDGG